jgi:hypothetical protein
MYLLLSLFLLLFRVPPIADTSCGSSIIGIRSKLIETNQDTHSPHHIVQSIAIEHKIGTSPMINQSAACVPIITITPTVDNNDGMLDRISHDLDYLLNRTSEIEVAVRPSVASANKNSEPTKTYGNSSVNSKSNLMSSSIGHSVHEVIIEESEEVDS